MTSIVNHLDLEAKLALIRTHPDLGSKAKMAEASVQEQAGVVCLRASLSKEFPLYIDIIRLRQTRRIPLGIQKTIGFELDRV